METTKRNTYIIAAASLLILIAAIYFLFIFPSRTKGLRKEEINPEIKPAAEIDIKKRPFVTLVPTSNGAEIVLTMENMGEFDSIEYELTYQADNPQIVDQKIERGATGTDVNTKDEKYKKSILLGTASKGTSSPDRGIADGKLTLHMLKGGIEYKSETSWDLFEVGARATEIKDRDERVKISLPSFTKEYWIIIADTVGVPSKSEFNVEAAQLPVYASFSIAPKFQKPAQVAIKADGATESSELYAYNHTDSTWKKLESQFSASAKTLTSSIDSFYTFVVVSPK